MSGLCGREVCEILRGCVCVGLWTRVCLFAEGCDCQQKSTCTMIAKKKAEAPSQERVRIIGSSWKLITSRV